MDKKLMAKETLEIIEQGYYVPDIKNNNSQKTENEQITIKEDTEYSISHSILFSPEEGTEILQKYGACPGCSRP